MTMLASEVISRLQGKTLVTAESCTGGAIGSALTAVPGASAVYKGGIISYCNEVKNSVLGIPEQILNEVGAVSSPVAEAMAKGARQVLKADIAVSVTGLAGPMGDDFGNPIGTVYIGYADENTCIHRHFCFAGDRDAVRKAAVAEVMRIILDNL